MTRRILSGSMVCLFAVLAAWTATSISAEAALLGCDASESRPFLPWLDPAKYVLAPGGSFETGGPRWTLSRGARIVPGNEPFYVHAASDKRSLSLPAGSVARTNRVCIDLLSPTLRFFVMNTGAGSSRLRVEVLFRDVLGRLLRKLTIARLTGGSSWRPTPAILVLANITAPIGTNDAQFTFSPTDTGGGWQVDDVFVDPWISHG